MTVNNKSNVHNMQVLAELENRVFERTQELEVMNAQLEELVKERTEELKANGTRLHIILENSMAGVAFTDKDSKILYVNVAFQELVRYSEKELIGRHYFELTHPDYIEQPFKEHELFEKIGDCLGVQYIYEDESQVFI